MYYKSEKKITHLGLDRNVFIQLVASQNYEVGSILISCKKTEIAKCNLRAKIWTKNAKSFYEP